MSTDDRLTAMSPREYREYRRRYIQTGLTADRGASVVVTWAAITIGLAVLAVLGYLAALGALTLLSRGGPL